MMGFAGELALNSAYEKRFAWEVFALGAVFTIGVPIAGLALGKVFGSAIFHTAMGKALQAGDELLSSVSGVVRKSIEYIGRAVSEIPGKAIAVAEVEKILHATRNFGWDYVQNVAQLYINGRKYTGINSWLRKLGARGDWVADEKLIRHWAQELGVINPTTGKVPHSAFLSHAEGHVLMQAVADGVQGASEATLVVTSRPCAWCRPGLHAMKEILHVNKLRVIFKDGSAILEELI